MLGKDKEKKKKEGFFRPQLSLIAMFWDGKQLTLYDWAIFLFIHAGILFFKHIFSGWSNLLFIYLFILGYFLCMCSSLKNWLLIASIIWLWTWVSGVTCVHQRWNFFNIWRRWRVGAKEAILKSGGTIRFCYFRFRVWRVVSLIWEKIVFLGGH